MSKEAEMLLTYIKYDAHSMEKSIAIQDALMEVEALVMRLPDSKPRALAVTKLEEAFMWIGKAIRDEQVERSATEQ
jgi:uncharacterized protein YpiB (UPF0302 family)